MVDIWQKPRAVLCKNFQENVTPKTATTVLRKPAQSKCTWTCRKSHFIRKFSSTMPQKKIKEISRGRLFARVCAVKMRMEMSQEPVFIREFAGKRSRPETGKTVLREPAQSKCTWTCQNFMREFSGKLPQTKIKDGSRGRLCASLHSRNAHKSSQEACTNPPGHADSQKSHIMREFSGKMPQANIKQTPRRRLCASLRSRNAHGHRTRASLCENLQERSRKPDGAP